MKAIITIEDTDKGVSLNIKTNGVGPTMRETEGAQLFAAVLQAIKDNSETVDVQDVKVGGKSIK